MGDHLNHPVSNVQWIPAEKIQGNDYNPNTVAPPEMELLEHSISSDGYTQPIVVWWDDESSCYVVVDGFHRHLVGQKLGMKELPVVVINSERGSREDRMAATIRHNRARGVHRVDEMSNIVMELSRRNWNEKKIAKELGMDQDEVLRLKQITGLAELFEDEEFSEAWEVE